MKKTVCSIISVTVAAAVLLTAAAGCGRSVPAPSPAGAMFDDVSLNVVTTFGPNDGGHRAFVTLCDDFEQATGASIDDGSADSTEEWKRNVIASFDTGDEPDVLFFFTGADTDGLIKNNKLVPIDEIREKYPDYASNINLTILEGLSASDGKSYAVPIKGYWERLFVNTDIFEKLELPLPEDYSDLFALAPALVEAGFIPIAASLAEVPHYLFEAFLFNRTGPSNHHIVPSNPDDIPESWVTALEQFALMYDAGMFPEDGDAVTHADAFELFQSKKAAMIIDGDWSVAYVRDTENTAVINFPADADGPRASSDLISGFSMGFYITQKAWNDPGKRDAAARFVQFITSDASILRLNVSGAAMPIAGFSASREDTQNNVTPLRRSIDTLNENTTAFVGATADRLAPDVREWLFGRILPLAKGELEAEELLREFIIMNNGRK